MVIPIPEVALAAHVRKAAHKLRFRLLLLRAICRQVISLPRLRLEQRLQTATQRPYMD